MDAGGTTSLMLRRFWPLIAAVMVLLTVATYATVKLGGASYEATSRVQVAALPQSSQASASIASQATAVATSPAVVKAALADAKIAGDAGTIAAEDVAVHQLGTSSLVDLTVRSGDRTQAVALASALAAQVVLVTNQTSAGAIQQMLKSIKDQMAAYGQQISTLDAAQQRAPLDLRVAGQLTSVRGLLTRLAGEYDQMLVQNAAHSSAMVVSDANTATRSSSHLWQKVALAGVAGLIIGLLFASLASLLWPRRPGARAVADVLGAPVLGRLPEHAPPETLQPLCARLVSAARTAGVDTVVVAGTVDPVTLREAVLNLDEVLRLVGAPSALVATDGSSQDMAGPDHSASGDRHDRPALRVLPLSRAWDEVTAAQDVGLIYLVSPEVSDQQLDEVSDVALGCGWRPLGVVETDARRRLFGGTSR